MANTKITNPELFNLGDSTSATQLPVMTTTQRIAMNAVATLNIDYLVVAGGGGGSSGYGGSPQGGGGAGGLRTSYGLISGGGATAETSLSLTGGTVYALEVGAGGAGATAQVNGNIGGSGGVSSFDAISTVGGGGSRSYLSSTPSGNGGSGGGQAWSSNGGPGAGTINQGYAGGSVTTTGPGAGGGGAGSAGSFTAAGYVYGIGGDGINIDITGSTVGYAGGGGRQVGTPRGGGGISFAAGNGPGGDGLPNTGGGGGGGRGNAGGEGGDGGSGVVILRYATADVASYTATGLTPTETTDGVDTVLSFTTVGTGTITFTSSTPTGTISTGEMIFNSITDKVEYFDGTKWYGITSYIPANTNIFNDNSCIAYYRFNGNADDETGNYNATASNETYSATGGKEGGYISLPQDSSGIINTNDSGVLAPGGTNVRSYSIWVQFQETGQYDTIWSQWRSSPTPRSTSFFIRNNNVGKIDVINYRSNSSADYYITTTTSAFTALNSWYNIVVSIGQSNAVTIWVNGTPVTTTGSGSVGTINNIANPNTTIGSLSNPNTGTYGIFDEARVFNRALTDAEALILWNEF